MTQLHCWKDIGLVIDKLSKTIKVRHLYGVPIFKLSVKAFES